MKKFFSLNTIKESIKFRDRKNSNSDQQSVERASIGGKRFSNLSTNSLGSRQSYLNIEVIREGYNVDLTRVDNTFTKLHRACLLNYDEKKLLKYIKKQPASINQIDNVAHCSPMHLCVTNNNIHYLSVLVDNGGDVNLCDGQGKTLLIKAIECTNEQIIQYLIARRAEVNKPDTKYKNSPLHWACLTAYFKAISILLNCTHINVNQANANEEIILHLIAKSSKNLYVFINDCLDNNNVNIDKQDIKGRTPLFIACLNGNYRCVELLLNNNADPNVHNLIGESPLQIAKSKGFVDIADLFENNTTNRYLKAMKTNDITDQVNKSSQHLTSPNKLVDNVKRNSVFSYASDVDFMKSVNEDDDSWPETVSNTSVNKKQLTTKTDLPTGEADIISFNSFKANIPINSSSSTVTLSNDIKNLASQVTITNDKTELSSKDQVIKKPVLHPENDEFIKQMKYLIDEEIQMNEELDEMLFNNQSEINHQKTDQSKMKQTSNNQITSIYLSESDEDWADENDTLIKKPNIVDQQMKEQQINESNSLKMQQKMIYGLSDGEDEQKVENMKNKEISSDESFSHRNRMHEAHIPPKIHEVNQMNHSEFSEKSNQLIKQSIDDISEQKILNSSLSSEQSLKDEDLVNKFDKLMAKIDEFEKRNQALSVELDDALKREKELRNLNNTLNNQYEEQNHQLIVMENRLKQSEENYELIRVESEQFKDDFKLEREKFEREFVKFMQEEHKQTEQHLMRLLDDKQELCNRLTDELNYLKDRYVNREQIPFVNDDLIEKLNGNQLFSDLMKQNDKMNENFRQLQQFLDEHLVLTESVKKLNQVLANLEQQFNQQSNQLNKQFDNQQNEFSKFIESNVVQYIQDLFRTEVEMKLIQVKTVVDELKQELIDFIHNYKLPKQNEQEITNLINQILVKSVKQSAVLNQQINGEIEEIANDRLNALPTNHASVENNELVVDNLVIRDELLNKNDDQNDSTVKDDEKTSLEFNADDVFEEEKQMSDREIEIKKIKKDKIKLNKMVKDVHFKQENGGDRLFSQYSDAIMNSLNNREFEFTNQVDKQRKIVGQNNLRTNFKIAKRNTKSHQFYYPNGNQFNYLNHLNKQSDQRKFKSKSINEGKFRHFDTNLINSSCLFNSIDSTDFHKQRQIVEKEIVNLKLQLGLLPTDLYRTSSSAWNL